MTSIPLGTQSKNLARDNPVIRPYKDFNQPTGWNQDSCTLLSACSAGPQYIDQHLLHAYLRILDNSLEFNQYIAHGKNPEVWITQHIQVT